MSGADAVSVVLAAAIAALSLASGLWRLVLDRRRKPLRDVHDQLQEAGEQLRRFSRSLQAVTGSVHLAADSLAVLRRRCEGTEP